MPRRWNAFDEYNDTIYLTEMDMNVAALYDSFDWGKKLLDFMTNLLFWPYQDIKRIYVITIWTADSLIRLFVDDCMNAHLKKRIPDFYWCSCGRIYEHIIIIWDECSGRTIMRLSTWLFNVGNIQLSKD